MLATTEAEHIIIKKKIIKSRVKRKNTKQKNKQNVLLSHSICRPEHMKVKDEASVFREKSWAFFSPTPRSLWQVLTFSGQFPISSSKCGGRINMLPFSSAIYYLCLPWLHLRTVLFTFGLCVLECRCACAHARVFYCSIQLRDSHYNSVMFYRCQRHQGLIRWI